MLSAAAVCDGSRKHLDLLGVADTGLLVAVSDLDSVGVHGEPGEGHEGSNGKGHGGGLLEEVEEDHVIVLLRGVGRIGCSGWGGRCERREEGREGYL